VHSVPLGLSHALGNHLRTAGVPHSAASGILLPHVMRFLEPATAAEQGVIARALANRADGLSAASLVEQLLDRLGVARRVSDFGVPRSELARVVRAALADEVVRQAPRPVDEHRITRLLEAAW
jgi:alcohol dehydrogenase